MRLLLDPGRDSPRRHNASSRPPAIHLSSPEQHQTRVDHGPAIPIHLLRLLRQHVLSSLPDTKALVPTGTHSRGGRGPHLRPTLPTRQLLPLPARVSPLLRRLPADPLPAMLHGRDRSLVLSELSVRRAQLAGQGGRKQVFEDLTGWRSWRWHNS